MSIHEFTLRATLPSAESDPAQYVEALYNAGCDDAVLGIGRKGVISLIFAREAETRGAAIASAIADVRSVLKGCEVELDDDLQEEYALLLAEEAGKDFDRMVPVTEELKAEALGFLADYNHALSLADDAEAHPEKLIPATQERRDRVAKLMEIVG